MSMRSSLVLILLLAGLTGGACADVKVGVIVSATGPAASLGDPEKKSIELLPTKVGNEKIEYIILDDASDTTTAVKNTRKLISEENVDIILGSSISPNSLAMIDVVAEAKVPMVSFSASARIVTPMDEKRKWVFKTPQNDSLMADAIAAHMAKMKVKTAGFIGFNDPYGESWFGVFSAAAAKNGIKIVASERFNKTDTSVTGQVLKLVSSNPDAILVAGAGTPAALPHIGLSERGCKSLIYQTHGSANSAFLKVGGKMVEKGLLPAGPALVTEQLDDSHPSKAVALEYRKVYEAKNGAGSVSTFGGYAWDGGLILQQALPVALGKAKPGTLEFRSALRDAIEQIKDLAGVSGVYSFSPDDHSGLDERARVMVTINNGQFKVAE